ncbi:hypothetical protein DAPPUDRAFT_256746 [Daphnia pulex]|uniref:Uncharacterized protein n=1 Tax=Daphnia pulex TaxID=6669 RepID=E9HC01_DAPPU|nr:hypothetical protein DAPPUDRAFT_256746 [Daphnia pulex]|eukprot:EFX70746.1 hypothetical protein DAPPUDRAFT_256746 [Daphnia pulex]
MAKGKSTEILRLVKKDLVGLDWTESVSSDEKVISEDEESTDDDDYDYNSFSSVYFYEEPSVDNLLQPLVPEDVTNDFCGAIQFIENFLERYEIFFPIFFEGSLGEAVKALITRVDDICATLFLAELHHSQHLMLRRSLNGCTGFLCRTPPAKT